MNMLSKGHLMNRGTLMVLKRILVSVLGAMGLAVGSALAQAPNPDGADAPGNGNVPAPDFFNDQIACSSRVPTRAASDRVDHRPPGRGGRPGDSTLDTLIKAGVIDVTNIDSDPDFFDDATAAMLQYIVPPGANNCGSGTALNAITVGMADDPNSPGSPTSDYNPGEGAIAVDVAEGYTEVLTAFKTLVGEETTLQGLLDSLKAEREKDDPSQTTITTLEGRIEDAREDVAEAQAALDAIAHGPIYQAGIAEWRAKGAVESAVTSWNMAVNRNNASLDGENATHEDFVAGTTTPMNVGMSGSGGVGLNDLIYSKSIHLADETSQLLLDLVDNIGETNAEFQFDELNEYLGIGSDGLPTTVANNNFTADGKLVLDLQDSDNADTPIDETTLPEEMSDAVGVLRARHKAANDVLEFITEYAAEFQGLDSVQERLDDAVARATIEVAHHKEQLDNALADSTDLFPDDPATTDTVENPGIQSIASYNAAYQRTVGAKTNAEAELRNAVADREDATAYVIQQFTSPSSFYQQLVDRRTALKARQDKIVADASMDGGTPSMTQRTNAANAAKALEDAQQLLSEYNELVADEDNPTVDLITELLKTGGDDGQALVDAISSNYDTANEAKTTADQVAEDVAGLTGDEGAVSENTRDIADNAKAIEGNTMSIDGIEAEIWGADASTDGPSRIDANETRSMENRTMIGENRGMITTNSENIVGLRTDVDSNTGRIMQNETDIMTNAGNIRTNSGRIDTNAGNISSNADAIAANMNSIGQNASAIGRNSEMITGLQDQMEIVRAGVAASMALAGMPAINGRGVSIGVGSFDGESAFAVGFQIQGEMASFKVGVTSSGGETGASAGVGFQF